MNIYKTKSGIYINLDAVNTISVDGEGDIVAIEFRDCLHTLFLKGETAKAFVDYLDKHLEGVYAGYA